MTEVEIAAGTVVDEPANALMKRRSKMCASCPFRGADDAYKAECAEVQPWAWPCHTEVSYDTGSTIQCRGHYEARRKFAPRAILQEQDHAKGAPHD